MNMQIRPFVSYQLVKVHRVGVAFVPKIVSEYDQEIPQSQTADNPVAPRGRATQPNFIVSDI